MLILVRLIIIIWNRYTSRKQYLEIEPTNTLDHKVRLRGDYGALNCNKLTLKLGNTSSLNWILAEEKVTFKYRDIIAKSSNMRYNLK